jgi:hypothetical protein
LKNIAIALAVELAQIDASHNVCVKTIFSGRVLHNRFQTALGIFDPTRRFQRKTAVSGADRSHCGPRREVNSGMSKILAMVVGTLVAGAGVSVAPRWAQSRPDPTPDTDLPGFLAVAQLSPNQERTIGDVIRAGAVTTRSDMVGIREIRDQIADELTAPTSPSNVRMQGLEVQIACLEAQLQRDRDDTLRRIRDELTPEQVAAISRGYRTVNGYREGLRSQLGP